MSQGAYLLTLLDTPWRELNDEQREAFRDFLDTAAPVDLYTFARQARRGGKPSSMTNMLPVRRGPEE